MYVNEIASIVHGETKKCDGNPNKNVGDAFLLVWRMPDEIDENMLISVIQVRECVCLESSCELVVSLCPLL